MDRPDEHEPATGDDWTAAELEALAADYFDMLRAELRAERYSKAEHNRRLQRRLPARSRGAIEFKHANLSAVLITMGLPYVRGYQPRRHYQAALADAADAHLRDHPHLYDLFEHEAVAPAQAPAVSDDTAGLFHPMPDEILLPDPADEPWHRRHRRLDLIEREAGNRALGQLGEQFVVAVERQRLALVGRDDLARRVTWAAKEWGDGLGFDVLSFHERTERERFIEVKTTNQGRHFPFYLTRTEVRCSAEAAEQFQLYRVFDFRRAAGLYVVDGNLERQLQLEPEVYRAASA